LGKGAHRPVPVGASAGGHCRGPAGLRDRLYRRPRRGVGPGQGHARGHPAVVSPCGDPCGLDDAGGDPGGPPGIRRGGRLPEGLRADRAVLGR
jgi:hypothetical protein